VQAAAPAAPATAAGPRVNTTLRTVEPTLRDAPAPLYYKKDNHTITVTTLVLVLAVVILVLLIAR